MAPVKEANKVKDEPMDNDVPMNNDVPMQAPGNMASPAIMPAAPRPGHSSLPAARGGAHDIAARGHPGRGGIAARGSSGRGGMPHGAGARGGAARGGGNFGPAPARGGYFGPAPARGGSSATRGGVTKARGGAVNLGARNQAPQFVNSVANAAGLATPSPGPFSAPAGPSASPSASPAGTAAEAAKKPRKQRGSTAASPQANNNFSISSDEDRKLTLGDLHMLETGDFYNAIIVCHDAQWHVHTQILASRSTWFRRAFQNAAKDGGIPEVNLASQSVREVEVLLYHIYSNGSLLESEGDLTTGSFTKFAKLYKLGETFEIQKLMDDALTCLGQFCDDKLQVVCSYAPTSGRNGILAHPDADFEWIGDLFAAIYFAFGTEKETSLQTMLVSFCFGGRMLFFGLPEFRHLVDNCWAFNTAMVKLMLPGSVDPFAPVPICTTAADVDHTHRSQKPDRCGDCKKTFSDVDKNKKALYHPWKAEVRATTYCGICVERMKKDGLGPPWRREPVGYNP